MFPLLPGCSPAVRPLEPAALQKGRLWSDIYFLVFQHSSVSTSCIFSHHIPPQRSRACIFSQSSSSCGTDRIAGAALLGHALNAAQQLIGRGKGTSESCLKQTTYTQLCEVKRENTNFSTLCCCLRSSDCPPGDLVKYFSCLVNTGIKCLPVSTVRESLRHAHDWRRTGAEIIDLQYMF